MTEKVKSMTEGSNAAGPFNASLTVVNLLDELDWVVGGYGKPTPQFLNSLNTFVESYLFTDSIFVSSSDLQHLNLASPAFPDGRPIVNILIEDKILRIIIEGPDHLKDDIGTVIYTFEVAEGKTLETDTEWFDRYRSDVDKQCLSGLIPSYEIGYMPETTPLLILGGVKGIRKHMIALVERDVSKCLRSILLLSSGSRLHPALPLYAAKAQVDFFKMVTPSMRLYGKLADIHNVKVEKLLKHRGYHEISIPPLTSILLSRCNDRTDFPAQLRKLRSEFQDLRDAGRSHEQRIENASTLGEQIKAIEEFDEFWEVFSKKTKHRTTRLIYRFWDIVKEGSPMKCFTKTVDNLVAWDQDQFILNRYKGLMDIWRLTRNIPPVQSQLRDVERIFGTAIASDDWGKYVVFANEVNRMIFPEGRQGD